MHGRHIEPAFGGPDVGEVGDPLLVRRRRLELRSRTLADGAAAGRSPRSGGKRRRRGRAARPCRASAARCDAGRTRSRRPARRARPAARRRCGRCQKARPHPCAQNVSSGASGHSGAASARHGSHCARHRAPRTATATGQIPRCFAMKANFISTPSRSRPRLF